MGVLNHCQSIAFDYNLFFGFGFIISLSGNRSSAMDPETLKSKKISHILTVDSSPLPDHVSQLKSIKKRLYIKLIDVAKEDLLDHLIDCFEFIDEALEDGGNVLVHW